MPYIDKETIENAKQIDLLSYLQQCEPNNLKRIKGNVYCTVEHDSLKISHGKWFWWSQGFGGKNALDYLIQVKNFSFAEAIEMLVGNAEISPISLSKNSDEEVRKEFILPQKNDNNKSVIRYLRYRGIDYGIICECISEGILYEDKKYHNAVFVGKDSSGIDRFASLRGTGGSSFKQDHSGSDKQFSFRLTANANTKSVHLFESAIDLLSYATYLKIENRDYHNKNLLSLSGVYQPVNSEKKIKIPVALSRFLAENPQIQKIILHLDNDDAGRKCTAALTEKLQKEYEIVDAPAPSGKDINDFLISYLKQKNERRICR